MKTAVTASGIAHSATSRCRGGIKTISVRSEMAVDNTAERETDVGTAAAINRTGSHRLRGVRSLSQIAT